MDEDILFDIVDQDNLDETRASQLTIFKNEEQQGQVIDYLIDELDLAKNERTVREGNWKKYRRQSVCIPAQKVKDFPWKNASNVATPLMMSIIHTITSKLVASFAASRPLWKVEAKDSAMKDHAEALSKYLNLLAMSKNHLDLGAKKRAIFYDLTRLGDQVIHMPWVYKQQKFRADNDFGGTEEVVKVIQDSPGLLPITIEDFFIRAHFKDIQDAPWVARRTRMYYHELQQKASQGIYQNVESLTDSAGNIENEAEAATLRNLGLNVTNENVKESTLFDIYEAYLFWDIDGNGVPEDIVVTFEPTTKTILRSDYNKLGIRPFENLSYITLPHSFYSLGVGDITTGMQEEADTLHNMDIDGRHLSMMQMKVMRRGSNVDPNMDYAPHKTILVEDMDDFKPFQVPDISDGAFRAEQRAQQYAREASGATAQMAGNDQSQGNRLGASGTMFLAQQANSILDSVRDNVSESFSRIGFIILSQLVANRDRVDLTLVSEHEAMLIQEILDIDIHLLPTQLKMTVRTTEMQETEEAKQKGLLSLWEVYSQFGNEVIQVSNLLAQGQLPEQMMDAVSSYYVGKVKMMEDLLEHFQVDDPSGYVPYIRNLELMLKQMDYQRDAQLGVNSDGQPIAQPLGGEMGQAAGPTGGFMAEGIPAGI